MKFLSLHERKETIATTLTNIATAKADKTLPISAKSTVAIENSADLMVIQTTKKPEVYVDENLIYIVNILNNGPCNATNVILTDVLPLNCTLVSINISKGSYSYCRGIVKCTLGAIEKYSNTTVSITITPNIPGVFKNFASVLGDEFDPNINNNSSIKAVNANPKQPRYRGFDFF